MKHPKMTFAYLEQIIDNDKLSFGYPYNERNVVVVILMLNNIPHETVYSLPKHIDEYFQEIYQKHSICFKHTFLLKAKTTDIKGELTALARNETINKILKDLDHE